MPWFIEPRSIWPRGYDTIKSDEYPLSNGDTWNENQRNKNATTWDIDPANPAGESIAYQNCIVPPATNTVFLAAPAPGYTMGDGDGASAISRTSSFTRMQQRFRSHLYKTEQRARIIAKLKLVRPKRHRQLDMDEEGEGEDDEDRNDSTTLVGVGSFNNSGSPRVKNFSFPTSTDSSHGHHHHRWSSTCTAVSDYNPDKIKDLLGLMSSAAKRSPPQVKKNRVAAKLGKIHIKLKRVWDKRHY